MKKKLLPTISFLLALLTGLVLFTSCHKKYNDSEVRDLIKANQEAIQKTQASIDSLKQVISAGATITKIVSFQDSTGGLAIYVSSQKEPYKLYNGVMGNTGATGEAGANATAWTISDDGFWVKDGEKTGYRAKGADGATGATGATGNKGDKGDPGANGTDGTNGKYYIPHDDGYFYLHEDGKLPDEKTDIQWKQPWITAILNADGTLTISGMTGATESATFSPTTLISIKLDMTCIDEVQDGYPVAYVARQTTNSSSWPYFTSDQSYYSQAITYYIYPSNAAISAQDFSLIIKKCNQETFDYDYQIQSASIDQTKGTLTVSISSGNDLNMANNIAMAYRNPPLFALKYKNTVLSDYAVAMPINGAIQVAFNDGTHTTEDATAWVQLWPGGPRFEYIPSFPLNNYKWGETINNGTFPDNYAYLDSNSNLKPQYDTVSSFDSYDTWRTPTRKELEEFCNRFRSNYAVSGNNYVLTGTGKFGANSLYLPKDAGGYWSSTWYTTNNAYYMSVSEQSLFTVTFTSISNTNKILPVLR